MGKETGVCLAAIKAPDIMAYQAVVRIEKIPEVFDKLSVVCLVARITWIIRKGPAIDAVFVWMLPTKTQHEPRSLGGDDVASVFRVLIVVVT